MPGAVTDFLDGVWDLLPEVAAGLALSIVSWLITLRIVRPRIDVSEHISRVKAADPHRDYVYRIKIHNLRRYRAAIDLSVTCRFGAPGFFDDRETNVSNYTIKLGTTELHQLKARKSRIFQLRLHETPNLANRLTLTGSKLGEKLREGTIRLEELLALDKAKLSFSVLCSDSLSNTTSVFDREYRAGAVVVGLFDKASTKINWDKAEGYERDELEGDGDDDEGERDDDD